MAMGRLPGGGPQASARASAPHGAGSWQRPRLVRQVRATRRPGDHRMVPLVGLPASAVTDRLYPVTATSLLDSPGDPAPGGAGSAGAAREWNPLLDGVQELLSEHAPELLEAHWTVEGDSRKKQVPGRLQNVLNLQSLTMMIDLVLGPGLVLHAIRSLPGGSERVQIVLQGRRDPHNLGYVYLESLSGNTVRYATRLGIERNDWSTARSGGLGSGAAQTREPPGPKTTAPPGGQGEGAARAGGAARPFPQGPSQPCRSLT